MSSFENATQSLCSIDGHLKHQTDVRNQDAQWTEPEVGHTKLVKLSCETGVGGQSGSCTTLTGMIDVNSLPVDWFGGQLYCWSTDIYNYRTIA